VRGNGSGGTAEASARAEESPLFSKTRHKAAVNNPVSNQYIEETDVKKETEIRLFSAARAPY
jgi:hypothetical protein